MDELAIFYVSCGECWRTEKKIVRYHPVIQGGMAVIVAHTATARRTRRSSNKEKGGR